MFMFIRFFLARFPGVHLVVEVFQTKVAHFCFRLVRIKMPLLMRSLVSTAFAAASAGTETEECICKWNQSAGRGLFWEGIVRVRTETIRTTETTRSKLKTTPFRYYKFLYFEKPRKPQKLTR